MEMLELGQDRKIAALTTSFYVRIFYRGDWMNDLYIKELYILMNKAIEIDCVPVGAIVVRNGNIIGRGFNKRNSTNLISDHAEVIAINEACQYLDDWRLTDCELYVTMYPCLMCLGAIEASRIKKLSYIADRIKNNVCVNNNTLTGVIIEKIGTSKEVETLLNEFFSNKRKNN